MDLTTHHLLLTLADGRLPVGGHTQSSGLEPAQLAGLPVEDVPGLLATRLRTVVPVDAGTAVVARHVQLRDGDLDPVVRAWAARTPGAAARRASIEIGRGLLRLLERLWPGTPVPAGAPRPVALGAVAAAAGLTARQTALLVAYDDSQTLATAAPKLYPLDPATTTEWVIAAGPLVAEVVTAVAGLTDPADIPSSAAPAMEAWIEQHADRSRRLFRA